jgi:hypothetical protein
LAIATGFERLVGDFVVFTVVFRAFPKQFASLRQLQAWFALFSILVVDCWYHESKLGILFSSFGTPLLLVCHQGPGQSFSPALVWPITAVKQ